MNGELGLGCGFLCSDIWQEVQGLGIRVGRLGRRGIKGFAFQVSSEFSRIYAFIRRNASKHVHECSG